MSEEIRLPYGEAADGRLVAVADVPRGKACELVCPGCRGALVARKGGLLRHHLAHVSEGSCTGAIETLLHRLGKQIIAESSSVLLPPLVARVGRWEKPLRPAVMFEGDTAEREASFDGLRPDVLLVGPGGRLAVEILVTHRCGPVKLAGFAAMGLDAIEIDLSRFRGGDLGKDFGAQVRRLAPRVWLRNGAVEAEQGRMAEWLRHKREQEALQAEQAARQVEALRLAAAEAALREARRKDAEWRAGAPERARIAAEARAKWEADAERRRQRLAAEAVALQQRTAAEAAEREHWAKAKAEAERLSGAWVDRLETAAREWLGDREGERWMRTPPPGERYAAAHAIAPSADQVAAYWIHLRQAKALQTVREVSGPHVAARYEARRRNG